MSKASGKFSKAKGVANRFIKGSVKFSAAAIREFTSSELAAQIAGTGDKKSKEYKAALRNVQRYKSGTRKPTAAMQGKIEKAIKALVKKEPKKADVVIGEGSVTLAGRMGYDEKDMRFRTVTVEFKADELGVFLTFARTDELEEAEEFFFEAYGAPLHLADYDATRLTIESGEE